MPHRAADSPIYSRQEGYIQSPRRGSKSGSCIRKRRCGPREWWNGSLPAQPTNLPAAASQERVFRCRPVHRRTACLDSVHAHPRRPTRPAREDALGNRRCSDQRRSSIAKAGKISDRGRHRIRLRRRDGPGERSEKMLCVLPPGTRIICARPCPNCRSLTSVQ
jgi:hypothetical protein